MGPVTLPSSGTVYIDSAPVIYSVERSQTYAHLLDALWRSAQWGQLKVVTSELTILECLVDPLAKQDAKFLGAFERFFASSLITLHPVDRNVLIRAAHVRSMRRSVRSPDAMHLATALLLDATSLLTNDRGMAAATSIPSVVVDDLLPSKPGTP